MTLLREYVISVTGAAVIAGVLTSLTNSKGTAGSLLRMMGGLFLAFTVLSPVIRLEVGDIRSYLDAFADESAAAISTGAASARNAEETYIKEQITSYILDKAEKLGAGITVDVKLHDGQPPVPEEVVIRGSVSHYTKLRLQDVMTEELGIAKENLRWIG